MGHESEYLERKKRSLISFLQSETNNNVKQWVKDYADYIEQRIEWVRVEEERLKFMGV